MKTLCFLIALILSSNICAQKEQPNRNDIFVRVFDFQGKKISKGKIVSITDSSLHLKRKKESYEIPLKNIYKIKTKRSAGNNLLTGAVIGATTLGIFMAIPTVQLTDEHSAVGNASGGALLGGVAGTVIGGITILFKNSKSYEINGDKVKWNRFISTLKQ